MVVLKNSYDPTSFPKSEKRVTTVVPIPYIGHHSILLAKRLKKLFKEINIDICVTFSATKVKSYFSLKDRTVPLLKSGVVYKFSCSIVSNCSYIGRTSRHLFRRVEEHSKPPSAVYKHLQKCTDCSHSFSSKFRIMDSSSSSFQLQILEALHIKNSAPTLNKQLHNSGSSFLLEIF